MTFRLYFNRCEDWPQIWSLDEGVGTPESNVCDWRTEGAVTMRAGRCADLAAVDRQREPVAWCEVECASVRLEGGVAVFVGVEVLSPNVRMQIYAPPIVTVGDAILCSTVRRWRLTRPCWWIG